MTRRKQRRQAPTAPASARVRPRPLWLAIGASLLLLAVLAWFVFGRTPPALTPIADQNVLLITIDTLRADALGSYGSRTATPALDRLAADGVRFDFAHAHAVVTLPSHVSILTGKYPFDHGIRDNGGYRLAPEHVTLAARLKARGFATGAFVSAFVLDAQYGLGNGFDVYDDHLPSGGAPTAISIPERRGDGVMAVARAWIDQQRGPWFAWVHLYDPHAPYTPPAPFDAQYAGQPYHGEVAWVDSLLAPFLERLRALPRTTLAIVTSDHGEGLGDHGETTHGLFAYEPTLRVPLIVAQLGSAHAVRGTGAVSQVGARHVDLVPTVLDLLGLGPPEGLPGRSLLPAINGDDDEERSSYFEAMSAALNRGWAPLSGVLAGKEKYIQLPLPELYNLGDDPGEQQNLVDKRDDRRRALVGRLQWFGNTAPGARVAESPEVVARLRALGYVSANAAPREHVTEADDPKRLVEIDRAVHRGMDLIERGQLRDAGDVYRQILAQRPDMALAYRHLSYAEWASGNPTAAITTLRRGLALGVVEGELQVQLGTYLAEAGNPREAISLLESLMRQDAGTAVLQTAASDADAYNALGIAYAREGQTKNALDAFDAALGIDAGNAMALQNKGSALLAAGDVAAALGFLESAVAADPTLASAWTALGAARRKSGKSEAAVQAWLQAIKLSPDEFDALYNLIVVLVEQGRNAQAVPLIERFLNAAPPARYGPELARLKGLAGR